MPDDSATLDAPQPHDAAPDAQPHAAKANNVEFVTRRVLLHETLIEEYETHAPFDETDDAPSAEASPNATAPSRGLLSADDLKSVRQPTLKKKDVDALRKRDDPATDYVGEESEEERVGARASQFFTLIAKAQREEVESVFGDEELRKEYLKKLEEAWGEIPKEERPSGTAKTYVEWALAHEIYGILDEEREAHKKVTGSIKDKEERKREIDRRAFISWLRKFPVSTSQTNETSPTVDESAGARSQREEARDAALTAISEAVRIEISDSIEELKPPRQEDQGTTTEES